MAINFAAASTAGLNNPGTEIITLVKDGNGNFINPPSYEKILAYLRSGDVPCLFVTDEAGTTGDIYQLSGYSETENKIRFSGEKTAIEFSEGSDVPSETEIGGGGAEITDGIVVKARDADGYATAADFYGSEVKVRQFGSDNAALFAWSKLAFLNFKNTITKIGDGGFRNSSIQIEIPNDVTAIGSYAFTNTKIATAIIPNGCTLGNACFSGAQSLSHYQDAQPAPNNYYQSTGVLANCKALVEATLGSVGHAVNQIRNNTFIGCTQTGLTITVYTTGAYADTAVANVRNGATSATIIIKASEATTYNGVSYAAGNTMITSEVA